MSGEGQKKKGVGTNLGWGIWDAEVRVHVNVGLLFLRRACVCVIPGGLMDYCLF